MSESKIEMKNVCKAFGSKKVLDGLDLKVAPGCSLVILGGSGTGKSVAIKCIQKLIRPDEGQIFIDGEDVSKMGEREFSRFRSKMGMLFQGGALFDSLRVWENVCFVMLENNLGSKSKIKDRAAELLAAVGLDSRTMELYPAELSGGMLKRVGLARAIAMSPEIIFFDEPTTGLDPIMSGVINNLIKKLVKELGATAVTITHDLNSMRQIADRVGMLYNGKIIWEGEVGKIDRSGNAVVKQFTSGQITGPIKW